MANESASKPMYEQIFKALRERIKEGRYVVGDRVPSEKELGDEFADMPRSHRWDKPDRDATRASGSSDS
ncbi:GntR family transcriptional regulator [Paenibacillus sp. PAMC21692]|uniref:GntR family transcriptional regulator n=1 Tax=Paenibacillus sp. PAMC21692 TaxID=2762320 RepID=UPI00164E65F4|nr:GntR family transcriptional regulator [Paenibacillus sp. PAMC21692]QNK59009.1 GntR family transcriptional regulator [Paenibacillus sp. PAMC21692]